MTSKHIAALIGGLSLSLAAGSAGAQIYAPAAERPALAAPMASAPTILSAIEIRTLTPNEAETLVDRSGQDVDRASQARNEVASHPGLVDQLEARGISLSDVVDVAITPEGAVTTIYVIG